MASTPTTTDAALPQAPPPAEAQLLVHLTTLSPTTIEPALSNIALAFPGRSVQVAVPEIAPNLIGDGTFDRLKLVSYTPATVSSSHWVLTADDYASTGRLAQEHNAQACLMLGADSHTLSPDALRLLAAAALAPGADLVVARYHTGPRESLLNSAILYPVTRALFCAQPRFPLAIDLGLSRRMVDRLALLAQRFTSTGQEDALLWPVPEATVSGFSISEADLPGRILPVPSANDLNVLLNQICGSLFSDIDTRATTWQRIRTTTPPRALDATPEPADSLDISGMLQSFQLAYTNLHEIWALVLPPQSLLGLKHLSVMPADSFHMPDSLWARIIYDFVLAYRLRTINRSHLMGALTPLYLAWVASHLTLVHQGTPPEQHIEELARTFENDKPYLVSRWRWPDRFNP